jgi:RNA polymerase sigma-70 factor (ECF subfamily)
MDLTHAQAVPVEADLETELVAAYPMLVRRLTFVVRDSDEAQDLAQAAFERAIARRSRFHGGDARAWLFTIGIRLAIDELRRRKRLVALTEDAEPEWAMRTEPDLWRALDQLDPRQRAALVLATLDGYTHAEIATMLGVREGTVSSWISRSKDRLRALLGDDR